MPAAPVPFFAAPPEGVLDLRCTILAGTSSTALLRASRACRSQVYNLRARMKDGRVLPQNLGRAEDQVLDLTVMEQVLATLSGAVEAAEREEAKRDAFHAQHEEAAHAA